MKHAIKWLLRQTLYARLRLLPLDERAACHWAAVMKRWPAIFAQHPFSVMVELAHGERMRVGLIDVIERNLLVHRVWDAPIRDFLDRHVQPGHTVIDIGGNIGYFTLQAARLVGETGRVVVFEPTHANLARLCEHLWINQTQNTLVASFAVGNAFGNPRIAFPTGNNAGAAHLRSSPADRGHPVFLRPLDSFFDEHEIQPDLIKLDIEGFEWEALKGMRQTLVRYQPIVLCELTPDFLSDFGQDSRSVLAYMENLGYHCEVLSSGNAPRRERLASTDESLPSTQVDVVFLPARKPVPPREGASASAARQLPA